jgi:hypothetical protein
LYVFAPLPHTFAAPVNSRLFFLSQCPALTILVRGLYGHRPLQRFDIPMKYTLAISYELESLLEGRCRAWSLAHLVAALSIVFFTDGPKSTIPFSHLTNR